MIREIGHPIGVERLSPSLHSWDEASTRDRRYAWSVFERLTDHARHVLVSAQEEVRLLGHVQIGTEHVLLGLAGEGEGVGARVLRDLGVVLARVRRAVPAELSGGGGCSADLEPLHRYRSVSTAPGVADQLRLGAHIVYCGIRGHLVAVLRADPSG